MEYETISVSDDGGSTSSSNGRQSLIETVIGRTDEGVVLNYDLPRDEHAEAKSGFWYFPANVLERGDGSLELLDRDIVQSRIDHWLKERGIPQEACGVWTHGGGFPYQVDCDPDSILEQIRPFDLRVSGLAAGGEFSHPMAIAPAIIERLPEPRNGYLVNLKVDQKKARENEAEKALILGQRFGRELSPEEAEGDAAEINFSGSIRIEFDLGTDGSIIRKSEHTKVVATNSDGSQETKTSRVTVERLDLVEAEAKFRP